jgi:hypothetical protein
MWSQKSLRRHQVDLMVDNKKNLKVLRRMVLQDINIIRMHPF